MQILALEGTERERERDTLKIDLKTANSAFVTGILMLSSMFTILFWTPSKMPLRSQNSSKYNIFNFVHLHCGMLA